MIKASKKWKDWWTVWTKHEKYIFTNYEQKKCLMSIFDNYEIKDDILRFVFSFKCFDKH
jgi:hypothetical protein